MGLLNLFKLEKLKIKAYEDPKRARPRSEFEAMFNPASFQQSYAIAWDQKQGPGSSGAEMDYAWSDPQKLTLDLILDGTGVHEFGFNLLRRRLVKDQVRNFLDVAYSFQGNTHQPNYLNVAWGTLDFDCRLQNVDVSYTAFERDGTPLRAELKVTFIGDKEAGRRAKEERRSSPDLTHSRTIRQGDTLPLLTREIYGSPKHYLAVARWNGLDDFRNLSPGQTLLFPPLERLSD